MLIFFNHGTHFSHLVSGLLNPINIRHRILVFIYISDMKAHFHQNENFLNMHFKHNVYHADRDHRIFKPVQKRPTKEL